MTWWGKSVRCCTSSKWVHLTCLLLSSKFRILGSSHFWSCPLAVFLLLLEIPHLPTLWLFLGLLQLVHLHCSIWPIWPPLLMQHSRPTLAFKHVIPFLSTLYLLPVHRHYRLMLLTVSLNLLLPLPPDPLSVFRLNAGCLQIRSTKHLRFLSFHSVDFFCIQESNLNLSSSFWIPGFFDLPFDRTHPPEQM